jgi:hypothetical protein
MIIRIENLKGRKNIPSTSDYMKFAEYKINIYKAIAKQKEVEYEIQRRILFTLTFLKVKYLRVNLVRCV